MGTIVRFVIALIILIAAISSHTVVGAAAGILVALFILGRGRRG